jgi:hypothetical protein
VGRGRLRDGWERPEDLANGHGRSAAASVGVVLARLSILLAPGALGLASRRWF